MLTFFFFKSIRFCLLEKSNWHWPETWWNFSFFLSLYAHEKGRLHKIGKKKKVLGHMYVQIGCYFFFPSWKFISKIHSSHLFSLWNLFSLQNMVWFFLFCLQRKHPALICSLAFSGVEAALGYCWLSKRPFGVREEWVLPWKCCRCTRCMWDRGAVPARSGCGFINLSICYLGRRLAAVPSLSVLADPSYCV